MKTMLRLGLWAFTAFALLCFGVGVPTVANAAEFCGTNVEINIMPPAPDMPGKLAALPRIWQGSWGNGMMCTALIIEDIQPDGKAKFVYIWGESSAFGVPEAGYQREEGEIKDGWMGFRTKSGTQVRYIFDGDALNSTFTNRMGRSTNGSLNKSSS